MSHIIKSFLFRSVLLACIYGLAGCTSTVLTRHGEVEYAPAVPVGHTPVPNNSGSIYMAATSNTWFEDLKARRVGDLLTVILDEQTDATKTASTGITKDNSTSIASPTILGQGVSLGGSPLDTSLTSANDFAAESDSSQSNKLQGNITVTVSQVLANGNLVVQGEKWIAINQGDEYVRLRGIVRPYDIAPDNTVFSNLIGDARITYRGKGAPAEAQAIGWLARFFNSALWPY